MSLSDNDCHLMTVSTILLFKGLETNGFCNGLHANTKGSILYFEGLRYAHATERSIQGWNQVLKRYSIWHTKVIAQHRDCRWGYGTFCVIWLGKNHVHQTWGCLKSKCTIARRTFQKCLRSRIQWSSMLVTNSRNRWKRLSIGFSLHDNLVQEAAVQSHLVSFHYSKTSKRPKA